MDWEKSDAPAFNRRSLLQAMSASLALAAAGGRCAMADERALPYVTAPEFNVQGRPKWYATSVRFAGYLQPVLGKSVNGRPVKLEGNASHPATRGATDVFMQAALLGLYDPARSQVPLHLGQPATWSAFDRDAAGRTTGLDGLAGDGFRLLTGAVSSPTMLRQIADLQRRWPKARWHAWEPVDEGARREAIGRLFGRPLELHLDFAAADIVVSLDDDFLGPGARQAVQARGWAARRQLHLKGEGADPRLFLAEPTPSATGTRADDRLIVAPARIAHLTQALAQRLGVAGTAAPQLTEPEEKWLAASLAAFRPGRSLVTVGAQHDPAVHGLALLINEKLGSFGAILRFTDPVLASPPDGRESLRVLVDDMKAGRVGTLMIIDADPVYATPTALGFADALQNVEFSVHAGLYAEATAARCHWHLPLQHELESWSDGRSPDGTAAIVQPLIRPFHDVRSAHVILDRWLGGWASDHDIVRASWKTGWEEALLTGFVERSAPPPVTAAIVDRTITLPDLEPPDGLTVDVRPDATIWDGRYAHNAWLQETPKPLTKATWGNVILVSPALARERTIETGDEVRLRAEGRELVGAAWIMPGQDSHTVTVTLGYGGEGLGYDAFAFVPADSSSRVVRATLGKTGKRQVIATSQPSQDMNGFDFVRTVSTREEVAAKRLDEVSFYPQRKWDSPSWGMSIDLDLCIGCNACSVACMAENNVPVVGKDLVAEGRQMYWLRIDHYTEGDSTEPRLHFQPVPCMHCEQAPCEMGCPVNATVHSSDGLNVQVYNRCIGTRTCSAYCPYKVRRFNWFEFTGNDPESIRAMRNPDVTVRSRGVMEKCTYCIQRISGARIDAKIEGRPMRDGDVVPACQQACPTEAIAFGDVTDPESAVSRRKAGPRDYSLLEEANTRPRTTYLARLRT
jgi:molybdopterin-containing oxidoreductase family iron-sulfur binding subunit